MINITMDNLNKLKEQADLKKLVTGEYLRDPQNENYQYIQTKFFKKESDSKLMLLNSGSNLFASVSDIFSTYIGNPNLRFYFPMKELTDDYITFGQAFLGFERKNGKLIVKRLPAEDYYREEGKDNFVRIYEKFNENGDLIHYYLITTYSGSIITNKLYAVESYISMKSLDSIQSMNSLLDTAEEVPLSYLSETENLLPVVDSGLPQVLYIIRKSDLDTELSEIEKIRSLVYTLDRIDILLQTEFLQHGKQYLLLKDIELPVTQSADYQQGLMYDPDSIGRVVKAGSEGDMKFVKNDNPLINQILTYRTNLIEMLSSVSGIPLDYLGANERVGSIGEDSRAMLHGRFVKKIKSIREIFDNVITDIIGILKSEDPLVSELYSWEDIIVKSDLQLAEELKIMYAETGIISKKTALKKYSNASEEEYQEEIDTQIKELELLKQKIYIEKVYPQVEIEAEKKKLEQA